LSDNKKYYYLKLKDNFFDREEIKLLEKQENGYIYSNLYLKLCLMSLKGEGRLLFRDEIPYDENMISIITGMPIDNIRVGIQALQKLGLIQKVDSGEIFVSDIQGMIGHGSSEAERIAEYRKKLKEIGCNNVTENVQQSSPEIEKEIEKDIKINNESFETFWKLYDKKTSKPKSEKLWNKIDIKLFGSIYEHVTAYVKSTPDKKFRKNPDTYLRNECWNDEIIIVKDKQNDKNEYHPGSIKNGRPSDNYKNMEIK